MEPSVACFQRFQLLRIYVNDNVPFTLHRRLYRAIATINDSLIFLSDTHILSHFTAPLKKVNTLFLPSNDVQLSL